MTTTIINRLSKIEREHNLKILFSCESGSRGWGFASPDSDYDVRFIYIKPFNHYLSISERDDRLGFAISDELDIYGWDIRKALALLRKSNTTPFEWLQSPVIYREAAGFREDLWTLCQSYFSRRSHTHHYLGIAKGALETMSSEGEIKIKKLFYVLRPLLAAKWCLEKDSIAPMMFAPLMTLLPADICQTVTHLVAQKATAAEGFMIPVAPELKAYITEEMDRCSEASAHLEKNHFEPEPLNHFFRKTLLHYDDTRTEG